MAKKKDIRKKIKHNSNSDSGSSNEVTLPLNSSLEFPQLGESSSIQWSMKKSESVAFPKVIENHESDASTFNGQKMAELNHRLQVGVNEQNIKKSKRPIFLDFSAFVKPKEKMNNRKGVLKSRALKHDAQLAGNYLDASNPIRCKGKYREQKKIKLSVLKASIIKERVLKSIASSDPAHGFNEMDIKKEICIYIKNMRSNERIKPVADKSSHTTHPDMQSIFTSKFKWYCENLILDELNKAASELIKRLVNLQDRAFDRDPVRARAHKRFVTGLREAKKYLKLQKVKLLIIAPDLETADRNGPLSLYLKEIKIEANIKSVPYAFALDRRKLGYCSLRKAPVSVFAILNYEGAEVEHEMLMKALQEARFSFEQKTKVKNDPVENDAYDLFKFMTLNENDVKMEN